MYQCRHFFVSGRVQGVFYRASTQTLAEELRLTGWVRNLNDGRVEVVACGSDTQLDTFELWLNQGPAYADVSDVTVTACEVQQYRGFVAR